MDSSGKAGKKHPFHKSVFYALRGILTGFRQERNVRIHAAVTVLVLIFGWFFSLNATEWLFILAAIGGTIALELVNSAIERTVDLAVKEYHPLAEQAKDMAAGAVLVYTIFSILVGIIIFVPKLVEIYTLFL
ncbi:diacylglycerol kinase family protein [Peribacillus sp. SCS-37]|uniref:diacylglycerol kinase family protein n=1 Tax=Paraperibacillus esterisolvens TaxID=3115296 RepID=UPI0039064F23